MAESTTTGKDSDTPEDCDICNYAFTRTDRCPKILPCGHTVCAHCINTLVKTNSKTCPKCRKTFEGRDASDFATDMAVIHKITLSENEPEMADLKADGTTKTDFEDEESIQLVKMAGALKEKTEKLYQMNLMRYDNADLDIQKEENYILELKESLLALNVDINSVTEVLKGAKENNTKTVLYLEGVTQLLQKKQKVRTERVKTNEENGKKIRSYHDLASLGSVADKFKKLNEQAKEFEQGLKALITKSEEMRISLQKNQKVWRENIDRIQDIPNFKEGGGGKSLQMGLSQELAEMKSGYDSPQHITLDGLRVTPDQIDRKIEEGEIFAWLLIEEENPEEQVKGGKVEEGEWVEVKIEGEEKLQRFARLSITKEDESVLHHMKEEEEEEESQTLNSHVVETKRYRALEEFRRRLRRRGFYRRKYYRNRTLNTTTPKGDVAEKSAPN